MSDKVFLNVFELVFKDVDASGKGYLTLEELKHSLKLMGAGEKAYESHFKDDIAEGREGKISLEAFTKFMSAFFGERSKPEAMKFLFKRWDENGDGMVCRDELRKIMNKMEGKECSEKELDTFMDLVDADYSGEVSYHELLDKLFKPNVFELIFKYADTDGNGYMDVAELKQVLIDFGNDDTTDFVAQMVMEGMYTFEDGLISLSEFLTYGRTLPDDHVKTITMNYFRKRWDENTDGTISRKELKRVMNYVQNREFTEEEVSAYMNMVDSETEDSVSYEELLKKMFDL